jgi:beta-lactamase regulating signal transducer with metallopeptidase domain
MTPVVLAALVGLASFFLMSTAVATGVAAWWLLRARQRPQQLDANRLLALRLLPTVAGVLVTIGLVAPAFWRFEPANEGEMAGPVLLVLGAAGAVVLSAGFARMARAIVLTRRLRQRWLASSSTLPPFDERAPAHLIDVPYPVVAIIGILRPILVISRDVSGGCSWDEVRLIAAHERAHLRAWDNLKRLLIDGCPDVLRWTPVGTEIAAAWSASAEDAADDAATGSDRRRRIALASVLVRVARMAIGGRPAPRLASALVGLTGVERRVRRLATADPLPGAPRVRFYLALAAVVAAIVASATSHDMLAITYGAAELIVGLGR